MITHRPHRHRPQPTATLHDPPPRTTTHLSHHPPPPTTRHRRHCNTPPLSSSRTTNRLVSAPPEPPPPLVADHVAAPPVALFVFVCSASQFDGEWDIHINAPALGLDMRVREHANTTLKGPIVGSNIPTVAEVTQGQVVKFASDACKMMGDDGMSVLLEGREQTVNYIDSPCVLLLLSCSCWLSTLHRINPTPTHDHVGRPPSSWTRRALLLSLLVRVVKQHDSRCPLIVH
jgi:hypothetical protein